MAIMSERCLKDFYHGRTPFARTMRENRLPDKCGQRLPYGRMAFAPFEQWQFNESNSHRAGLL